MIYRRLLIAVLMALAACEARPASTPTAAIPETPTPEPSVVANSVTDVVSTEEPTARWIETEMDGISLGMWQPVNWETDLSNGLVLAEHTVAPNAPSEEGILVYCFVPSLEDFKAPEDAVNYAWAFLDWVVRMPDHTGWDVSMSDPEGFEWDEHDAAYYLMTIGDGVRMIVLAVAIPDENQIVACNISATMSESHRIRATLPQLLDGMMVEGRSLDSSALDVLPDPLQFPRYNLTVNRDDKPIAVSNSR